MDVKTGIEYAAKFNAKNPQAQTLLTECLYLKQCSQGLNRVPKYVFHTTTNEGRRFLIFQLLEQSLEDHIKQREAAKEVYEDIISDIAVQMLEAV